MNIHNVVWHYFSFTLPPHFLFCHSFYKIPLKRLNDVSSSVQYFRGKSSTQDSLFVIIFVLQISSFSGCKYMYVFFSSIFFNISLLFIWSLYIIPSNFWCNRNDFPIVICHLGGASEFRQVALVNVFPFQYQTPSATSTAWTGAHRTFTEETFLNR